MLPKNGGVEMIRLALGFVCCMCYVLGFAYEFVRLSFRPVAWGVLAVVLSASVAVLLMPIVGG